MAKVQWAQGIEYVSGLLTKRPKKGDRHASHGSALLATHRVAETTNPTCTRLYMVGEYNRSTPVTVNELENRGRFDAVSKAVAARAKDLMKISSDQAAFLAQKDQPGGKKTMKAYLWKVCGDEWDAQHGN
jgi:hypothetical protein